jgi:hypothetical protein
LASVAKLLDARIREIKKAWVVRYWHHSALELFRYLTF